MQHQSCWFPTPTLISLWTNRKSHSTSSFSISAIEKLLLLLVFQVFHRVSMSSISFSTLAQISDSMISISVYIIMFWLLSLAHCVNPPTAQSCYTRLPTLKKNHHTNNIFLEFTVGTFLFSILLFCSFCCGWFDRNRMYWESLFAEINGSVEDRRAARPSVSVPNWFGTLGTTEELMSAQASLWKYVWVTVITFASLLCRLSF